MSEILNTLNNQYATVSGQIAKLDREIVSLQGLISSWTVERNRLQSLYDNAGWTVSKSTKDNYIASKNNAQTKINTYQAGIDSRNNQKAILINQLNSIQKNIDDFQQAVESSISMGIPEEGSIQLADDFVRAEMELRQQEIDQNEEAQEGATINRKIFVTIGVIIGALLIWFMIKKIKKGKKK